MADEREKLEENIRKLEAAKASGVLDASVADASIAALREKLATYSADLNGDGAIAQGPNAKAVGAGGVMVGDNFQGNIYMGEDPAEDEKRLAVYRRWVMQSTSNLPLRGVDVGASDPTGEQKSIGLANVYVDLDTTSGITKINALISSIGGGKKERSLRVIESVYKNRDVILLGEPGGGKSTFVNFLAHCLAANALEPEKNWISHLNGWPKAEAEILPVVVILRDFARSFAEKLPAKAEPQHLLDFIGTRLKAQNMGFALPLLEKALDAGQAILLLDGLDEVPTQAQRIFVRDAVRAFITRYEKIRFLVTCRVLSYQPPVTGKPDLRLNELPTFEIAPFDQEKIDRFVSAWYTELGRMGSVPADDVSALTARLREAVRRPDLQRLAPNPLLLTVMSLVHTHRGRLPDARALLYEETVDILLWRWEQIKLGGQESAPRLRQYLMEAGRTDVDLKRVLWQLAYEAHDASQPDAKGEALADIAEHRILKALAALKCDDANPTGDLNWARHLVDLMKVRAGLLLERQPEIFTFPHRTFQEYLAGAHLAAQADFSELVSKLAHKDMTLWRESILYAAGKLVYVNGDVAKPLALVAELCPDDVPAGDMPWRLAWLAGDILQEVGLKRVRDSAFGRDLLKRIQNRLPGLLEGGKLSPRERARAGNILAQLGDPRFDPERFYLPKEPNFGFIHIPAGKFIMGANDISIDEKPQHELDLPEYWLAKYPVTVAQYRAFVDTSGYKTTYKDNLNGIATHPVVNVTWYDAIAYCKWLNEQLSVISTQFSGSEDPFWSGIASGKLTVGLPSEAEWEKAGRGTDGRVYPWGNEPDPNLANYSETGIGGTSPVGAFPGGQSSLGLLDMSGNVWEWTRSIFGRWDRKKSEVVDLRKYPYLPDENHEKVVKDNDLLRCVRGGAFHNVSDDVRCALRGWYSPDYRLRFNGFRVGLFFSRASPL
jgi:formylglycine-generating enzyme required for sulfatase activity